VVLVIDNYDSFTYNLVQYLAELGATPEVRRNDRVTVDEVEGLAPEAVVISPGPGRPEDAGICVEVIRRLGSRLPILGVCLGHQAIGLAYGGTVELAPQLMHGKTSDVRHFGGALYAGVPSPFVATRYHSLCVRRDGLPAVLEVTADCPEDGVIMGLRHRQHPVEGVQFHPESILTAQGKRLLANFLAMAGGGSGAAVPAQARERA
jgi:anthranilate synthase/aminodeoxychorismate synthase-like glutamine amidotransferase